MYIIAHFYTVLNKSDKFRNKNFNKNILNHYNMC
nr:MAG TPA: hypothetical protein [Caudoviricetes sp.]